MDIDFKPWPKNPRLFRDITVTEKLDGTNAGLQIHFVEPGTDKDPRVTAYTQNTTDGSLWALVAQSRNRIITPDSDNAGFARWVRENAAELVEDLGEGTHFGEWWGQGINRTYDLDHKRFSLFNTKKWGEATFVTPDLSVVPVLYEGPFSDDVIRGELHDLKVWGSEAKPGFMNPEGVVVFHKAANHVFKVLIENDAKPKSVAKVMEAPVKKKRFWSRWI